jgi:uncharacterized protein (DUF2236 family)
MKVDTVKTVSSEREALRMDARVTVHGGPVAQPAAVILQTAVHPYIPTAVLAHKAVRSEPVHRPGGGLGQGPYLQSATLRCYTTGCVG